MTRKAHPRCYLCNRVLPLDLKCTYCEVASATSDKIPDTEKPPPAWKIKVWDPHASYPHVRTVYSSVATYEDAVAIAQILERVAVASTCTKVEEWNPDQPDSDSTGAISLETAILWTLGR